MLQSAASNKSKNPSQADSSKSTPAPSFAGPMVNSVWFKLATYVGESASPAEAAADQFADAVSAKRPAPTLTPMLAPTCACGGTCDKCAARKATTGSESSAGEGQGASSGFHGDHEAHLSQVLSQPGVPLDSEPRDRLEKASGASLNDVRVHTDHTAAQSATGLGALAYTLGSHVVFSHGAYQPHTDRGFRLLAHEIAHTQQQKRGTGAGVVQRTPNGPDQAPRQAKPEDLQKTSGPCEVVVGDLTNEGLLFQLNKTRAYLVQHKRGEGEFYDYANLLRRLNSDRRRRIGGGHVWMGEVGLAGQVPAALYALKPSTMGSVAVESVSPASVSGPYQSLDKTVLTEQQFYRFLSREGIPTVDPSQMMDQVNAGQPGGVQVPLRERQEKVQVYDPNQMQTMFSPFGYQGQPANPLAPFMPKDSRGQMAPWGANSPFGQQPQGSWGMGLGPLGLPEYRNVPVSASSRVSDLRSSPYLVSGSGPERVKIGEGGGPARSPSSPIIIDPSFFATSGQMPEGSDPMMAAYSMGMFGQPGVGLPNFGSGIMWEGSHVSDLTVVNNRPVIGGYRASLPRHGMSDIERFLTKQTQGHSGGGRATSSLNRGTPGTYANDVLFPMMPGAVVILRKDGTPATSTDLIKVMADAGDTMKGDYRYSTPPKDSKAYQNAYGDQPASFCAPGARNCINLPMAIHEQALGGPHLTLPQDGGGVIDLSDPSNATAKNMNRYVNLPDEFFESRGLQRIRISGGTQLKAAGAPGAASALLALGMDMGRMASGDENVHYLRDPAMAFGSGTMGFVAENYASNAATQRFVSAGMGASRASMAGRVAGGTGVAFVLAPAVTGIEMLLDDEEYTKSDYGSRMGRSAVSAGGGALAAIGTGALLGSPGGPVGFVIGAGAGFVGYLITDALVGDAVEAGIRDLMGEGGCTGGVGRKP